MMLENNSPLVLVTYSSKYGSTAEIARHIGRQLENHGVNVETDPMKDVRNLCRYDAVILGSAIYYGRWRGEAISFLKKHKYELTKLPVWIFSSGPTGKGDALELLDGVSVPSNAGKILDRIKPVDAGVFHGNIDLARLGFFERCLVKKLGAPSGDFRDWKSIEAWADGIAAGLAAKFHLIPEVTH